MSVNIDDILPLPEQVDTGRAKVDVYGVTLEQLAKVLAVYQGEISSLFVSEEPDFGGILLASPLMAADIIALAIDAVGQEETIRGKMPLALQIEILSKCWKLSVPDSKNLNESLYAVLATLQKAKRPASKSETDGSLTPLDQ